MKSVEFKHEIVRAKSLHKPFYVKMYDFFKSAIEYLFRDKITAIYATVWGWISTFFLMDAVGAWHYLFALLLSSVGLSVSIMVGYATKKFCKFADKEWSPKIGKIYDSVFKSKKIKDGKSKETEAA